MKRKTPYTFDDFFDETSQTLNEAQDEDSADLDLAIAMSLATSQKEPDETSEVVTVAPPNKKKQKRAVNEDEEENEQESETESDEKSKIEPETAESLQFSIDIDKFNWLQATKKLPKSQMIRRLSTILSSRHIDPAIRKKMLIEVLNLINFTQLAKPEVVYIRKSVREFFGLQPKLYNNSLIYKALSLKDFDAFLQFYSKLVKNYYGTWEPRKLINRLVSSNKEIQEFFESQVKNYPKGILPISDEILAPSIEIKPKEDRRRRKEKPTTDELSRTDPEETKPSLIAPPKPVLIPAPAPVIEPRLPPMRLPRGNQHIFRDQFGRFFVTQPQPMMTPPPRPMAPPTKLFGVSDLQKFALDPQNTHTSGMHQTVMKTIQNLLQNIKKEEKTNDSKEECTLDQTQERENSEIFNYYWQRLEERIKKETYSFYGSSSNNSEAGKILTLSKKILNSIKHALLLADRRPKLILEEAEKQILNWQEYTVAKEVYYLLFSMDCNSIEYSNTTITIRDIVALLWSALKQDEFLKIGGRDTPKAYREHLLRVNLFEGFDESSRAGCFDGRVHALISSLNDCHVLIHTENISADNLPSMIKEQYNENYKVLSPSERNQLIKVVLRAYVNAKNGFAAFFDYQLLAPTVDSYFKKFTEELSVFTSKQFKDVLNEIVTNPISYIDEFPDFKKDSLKAIESVNIESTQTSVSLSALLEGSLLTQSSSSQVPLSSPPNIDTEQFTK